MSQYSTASTGPASLADELAGPPSFHSTHSSTSNSAQRSMLAMKCGYLMDEDSSPDSERLNSLGDVDSGHSTAHSPTDFKSMSPPPPQPPQQPAHAAAVTSVGTSPSPTLLSRNRASDADEADEADDATTADMPPFQPPPFGGIPYSQIEMLEATHRGLHKFIPRHRDEIEVEIGDSVYVQREADDLWCEGVNLRTGRQGIFPSAYAVDLDYNDFDPTAPKVKRERYLLGYLGSVETLAHKGTGVVCQAVRKIVGEFGESPAGQLCILEISDQGLRMVDRSSKVS